MKEIGRSQYDRLLFTEPSEIGPTGNDLGNGKECRDRIVAFLQHNLAGYPNTDQARKWLVDPPFEVKIPSNTKGEFILDILFRTEWDKERYLTQFYNPDGSTKFQFDVSSATQVPVEKIKIGLQWLPE